ncbi:hypothetical protein HMPREF1316_0948 [Olsenella profusa F0195]|uniref:Uncharacterized protein n=1 Tax=Olsenella profusa F0195 TaxID=1125712 RepID=U2UUV7_9ACTN|nr:hypothetical protein HMPREF1316_0948 [Olsenella profusa F0195]
MRGRYRRRGQERPARQTGGPVAFSLRFPHTRTLVVGSATCSVESFFLAGEHELFAI